MLFFVMADYFISPISRSIAHNYPSFRQDCLCENRLDCTSDVGFFVSCRCNKCVTMLQILWYTSILPLLICLAEVKPFISRCQNYKKGSMLTSIIYESKKLGYSQYTQLRKVPGLGGWVTPKYDLLETRIL